MTDATVSKAVVTTRSVVPKHHASSSRSVVIYSEKIGTSALISAPLKTPFFTVGTMTAERKASSCQLVPKNFAYTTSRPKPKIMDASVTAITRIVERATCLGPVVSRATTERRRLMCADSANHRGNRSNDNIQITERRPAIHVFVVEPHP